MEEHIDVRPNVGRFAFLLGEDVCPRPIYDEILLETHGCVVTPTLGSIVANWVLIIPRTPVINFAVWQAADGAQPNDLVQEILIKHNIAVDRAIWFEHGPSSAGSSIGCGVDQAHLHLIADAPFSFQDFVSSIAETSQLCWQNTCAKMAHQSVTPGASYLIAASMDQAVVAQSVESVGSQYFRRVVANLVQQPDAWNYWTYPYLNNVRRTIRAFGTQFA
jgi:ATP adenylyltransferase